MGEGLSLRSVRKTFQGLYGQAQLVLDGLDVELEAGGLALLDGPSGAGKSTLLNIVAGLILPDSGSVTLGATTLSALSEARRDRFRAAHIGYIFQSFNLLSPLSVIENLTVPLRLAGMKDPTLDARARATLERLGLAAHIGKRPYELSVGQRQRVAVARALLMRPALLLADEPTASLDAASAREVRSALLELHAAGTLLLIATHDPELKSLPYDLVLSLGAKEVAA